MNDTAEPVPGDALAASPNGKRRFVVWGGIIAVVLIAGAAGFFFLRVGAPELAAPSGGEPKALSRGYENVISISNPTDSSIKLIGAIYSSPGAPTTDPTTECYASMSSNCGFAHTSPGKYSYRFTVVAPSGDVKFSLSLTHSGKNVALYPSELDTAKDGRGLATTFELPE
jgi:hypothetical protein